jgi:hypothetical protein
MLRSSDTVVPTDISRDMGHQTKRLYLGKAHSGMCQLRKLRFRFRISISTTTKGKLHGKIFYLKGCCSFKRNSGDFDDQFRLPLWSLIDKATAKGKDFDSKIYSVAYWKVSASLVHPICLKRAIGFSLIQAEQLTLVDSLGPFIDFPVSFLFEACQ